MGTHAVRGVVTSMTPTSIVIARPAKRGVEMAFVVTASTARAGTFAIGSQVSIRYLKHNNILIATATAADP